MAVLVAVVLVAFAFVAFLVAITSFTLHLMVDHPVPITTDQYSTYCNHRPCYHAYFALRRCFGAPLLQKAFFEFDACTSSARSNPGQGHAF